VDWPILLGKLMHVANICVYMCVGLWSVCSGVVAPGLRSVALTVMTMMMPWKSRERLKSLAGSKEAKILTSKRKKRKKQEETTMEGTPCHRVAPPDRAGRR
jgi:hypothetical protein